MTYVSEWKSVIKPIVDGVAKLKPASSGLQGLAKNAGVVEKALKAVDAALDSGEAKTMKKAYQDYVSTAFRYNVFANTSAREIATDDRLMQHFSSLIITVLSQTEQWRQEIKVEMQKLMKEGEMDPTYHAADWQAAKKNFEAVTKKKKPSAGFLGPFRKSAGIDKCVKAIDAASAANDLEAFKKAVKAYETASRAYSTVLVKAAAKEPKESSMATETLGLKSTLEAILGRCKDQIKQAGG